MKIPSFAETIARMKQEILADARDGVISLDIKTFDELDDGVDNNSCHYGGLNDPDIFAAMLQHFDGKPGEPMPDEMVLYYNNLKSEITEWFARGGLMGERVINSIAGSAEDLQCELEAMQEAFREVWAILPANGRKQIFRNYDTAAQSPTL